MSDTPAAHIPPVTATPTDAPPAPIPQNPNPGGTPPADWMNNFPADVKGYAELKGFKDPASVVDSYRNMEKLMGAPKERLLRLPDNMDEPGAMNDVYNRLGRPAKPSDYKVTFQEGAGDESLAKWMQETFHENGLTAKQAEKFVERWNSKYKETSEASAQKANDQFRAQETSLKTKWGAAYDQNKAIARSAAREFGVTPEVIDKLESSMGYDGVMEFMNQVGSKLGEGDFHLSTKGSGMQRILPPDAAKAAIDMKRSDAEFVKKLESGNTEAKAEWDRLHQQAFPQQTS